MALSVVLALPLAFATIAPRAVGAQSSAEVAKAEQPTARSQPLFRKRDAMMAGAFVLAALAVAPGDRYFAKQLQDSSNQSDPVVRLASTDVSLLGRPGLLIIGSSLYAVGRVAHQDMLAHVGLHATEAMVIGELANTLLKGSLGRERPRSEIDDPFDFRPGRGFRDGNFRSLPSAHTVSAFAFAAAMTEETARHLHHAKWCVRADWCLPPAWVVGPVAYSAAGLIGLTRMYNNEHWASDILIGAGIGTLSGLKVVQHSHEHPSNLVDRALLHVSAFPTSQGGVAVFASLPVR